jgi:hypothetical protein
MSDIIADIVIAMIILVIASPFLLIAWGICSFAWNIIKLAWYLVMLVGCLFSVTALALAYPFAWYLDRRQERRPKLHTTQAKFGSEPEFKWSDIVINIVDEPPPRKQRKKIELRKNARGVYSPDGS